MHCSACFFVLAWYFSPALRLMSTCDRPDSDVCVRTEQESGIVSASCLEIVIVQSYALSERLCTHASQQRTAEGSPDTIHSKSQYVCMSYNGQLDL